MSSEAIKLICSQNTSWRWEAWWRALPRYGSSSFEPSSDASSERSRPIRRIGADICRYFAEAGSNLLKLNVTAGFFSRFETPLENVIGP